MQCWMLRKYYATSNLLVIKWMCHITVCIYWSYDDWHPELDYQVRWETCFIFMLFGSKNVTEWPGKCTEVMMEDVVVVKVMLIFTKPQHLSAIYESTPSQIFHQHGCIFTPSSWGTRQWQSGTIWVLTRQIMTKVRDTDHPQQPNLHLLYGACCIFCSTDSLLHTNTVSLDSNLIKYSWL